MMGGNGMFMCSGPPPPSPPNSCMIYLGQSKWPEDRKKSESPYVQSYKKDLIQALSYHLSRRQGPPCVKDSSLELLCLKAWKTGTDSELEINNLLNNSWYLPDLKSCANEAPWDFIPISALGDEDRLWMSCVCRRNSQDDMTAELHLDSRHPTRGLMTGTKWEINLLKSCGEMFSFLPSLSWGAQPEPLFWDQMFI